MNGGRGERWAEVERLLDQVLDTKPEARPSLLARIRADDPEMAIEIERLLDAIATNEHFLQESAPTYAAPLISRMLERNDLTPGTVLGGYEITGELGRGGMATVYLAQDLKLHRQVALKVLRRQLAASLGSERFLREIAIAARLSHPHILPLHDSCEADGQLYYAMPYVEGESLRQKLEREGQLPVAEMIGIVSAVAGALTYAHQQGIVHRDIKPENILLTTNAGDGTLHPLVADFGIARAVDKAGGERLTETGIALGTPAYMSPEQASPDCRLDSRSDIYSLGCVAYEMLAGEPPFTGPSPQAIVARHAVDRVPPLRTVRSTVPAPVEVAIERALAKVPADRFSTAEEFARALEAKSISRAPRRWTSAFRWRRIAPAFVLLAAAIGLGVQLFGNSAKPAVLPSASKIAVLPLLSLGSDTALAQLGRDLANTISASLNGVGGIETADRLTMAANTAGEELSPANGAQLARRMGATSVVHGTLVGAGDQVRLDLGLYGSERLEPLARGITVTAHRDSIRILTDSASLGLLRQIWRRGEPPSPSLAAVTTGSLPGLRAFLDGEREIEKDQWETATMAFSSAIAADSTFWLAYFRYALARYWREQDVESLVTATLNRHRDSFPERERMLIDAWNTEGPAEFERYREVTRRFPDYWPGWFMLGDRIYHMGPLHGVPLAQSQAAFQRAVALNPRLKPAWVHLFGIGVRQDTLESERALPHILRFSSETKSGPPILVLHRHRIARLQDELAHSSGIVTPMVARLADSVAQDWASLQANWRQRQLAPWALLWYGFPGAAVYWNQSLLKAVPRIPYQANMYRAIAWGWAMRGAWDSTLSPMHLALQVESSPEDPNPPTAMDEYGLAVLGVWLGALAPSAATAPRAAAARFIGQTQDSTQKMTLRGRIAWLDGLLAFTRRDREGFERARQEARASHHPQAAMIERSMAAFGQALRGDRAAAGRAIAALESTWLRSDYGEFTTPDIGVHRIAAATWLLEAGDTAQASRLLTWHQSTAISAWETSLSYPLTPLAYLMLARIEEAQGRTRTALDYYRQFLRRYDSPGPSQRHLADEARVALARLSGSETN